MLLQAMAQASTKGMIMDGVASYSMDIADWTC